MASSYGVLFLLALMVGGGVVTECAVCRPCSRVSVALTGGSLVIAAVVSMLSWLRMVLRFGLWLWADLSVVRVCLVVVVTFV